MDNPELAKVADALLKESYVQHLIREEAHRQAKTWFLWPVLTIGPIVLAMSAWFGWDLIQLKKNYDVLKAEYTAYADGFAEQKAAINRVKLQVESDSKSMGILNASAISASGQVSQTVQSGVAFVTSAAQQLIDARTVAGAVQVNLENFKNQRIELDAKLTELAKKIIEQQAYLDRLRSDSDVRLKEVRADTEQWALEVKKAAEAARTVERDFRRLRVFQVNVVELSNLRDDSIINFGSPVPDGSSFKLSLRNFKVTPNSNEVFFTLSLAKTSKASGEIPCIPEKPGGRVIGRQAMLLSAFAQSDAEKACVPIGVSVSLEPSQHLNPLIMVVKITSE